MASKRNWRRWIIIAALVVVAVAGFLIWRSSQTASAQYNEETARTGSLQTYYSFSGNVQVRNSQAINAKINATVREIYVQKDTQVAAGTPLLRLSSGDIIKADIAGEVTEVHVSEGDTVSMGAALVDIVDFEDLQVIVKVDEFDIAAVSVGVEAEVTIDALGRTYKAEVEHISKTVQQADAAISAVSSGGDVSYYEAKLSAPEDLDVLPGMKVDVRILNEEVSDAVLLSMSALQFDAYNKPYVLMRASNGRDVAQVSVGVGIQDGTTVQITDGLRAGDVVLVPRGTLMFPMMGQMR